MESLGVLDDPRGLLAAALPSLPKNVIGKQEEVPRCAKEMGIGRLIFTRE